MIRLANQQLSVEVSPAHGGGVLSFDAFGEPVLRPAPPAISAPTDLASFALLPYCNRLERETAFDSGTFKLDPTLAGEVHPLHGEGWIDEWEVETATQTSAVLSLTHSPAPGRWPWKFKAKQSYALNGLCLTHCLELLNLSSRPMPAGLGFHPYFLRDEKDLFTASVSGMWETGLDQLPTLHRAVVEKVGLGTVLGTGLDNCFTGWDGVFRLDKPGLGMTVRGSDHLTYLHIYTPNDADFYCIEPVSHAPNALNAKQGASMQVLAPGDTMCAFMSYTLTPRD